MRKACDVLAQRDAKAMVFIGRKPVERAPQALGRRRKRIGHDRLPFFVRRRTQHSRIEPFPGYQGSLCGKRQPIPRGRLCKGKNCLKLGTGPVVVHKGMTSAELSIFDRFQTAFQTHGPCKALGRPEKLCILDGNWAQGLLLWQRAPKTGFPWQDGLQGGLDKGRMQRRPGQSMGRV